MKRIGIAAALAFALMAGSAVAVEINPFALPYSGPAQNGSAEVGFKIVDTDTGKEVKKFQFDSIVANCDKGKIALADQIQGGLKLRNHGHEFWRDDAEVVNNPKGKVDVSGHKLQGQDAWAGSLVIKGRWSGAGECHSPPGGIGWGPATKD